MRNIKKYVVAAVVSAVLVPATLWAAGGMVEYQKLELSESVWCDEVQKFYDHDEGIVCYVVSCRGNAISCVTDAD
jgi:hypothetical protein